MCFMSQIVTATFVDGAFHPDAELDLTSGTRVRLIVEQCEPVATDKLAKIAELHRVKKLLNVHATEPHLTRDQLHERR